MVYLEESFLLNQYPGKVIVGIEKLYTKGEGMVVVVTVQNDGIHLYNLMDQKCFQSWYLKRHVHIMMPVIHHPETKQFYLVHDKCRITVWKETCMDLEHAEKKIVWKNEIMRFHLLKNGMIIIKSRDGSMAWCDADLNVLVESEVSDKDKDPEMMVWKGSLHQGTWMYLSYKKKEHLYFVNIWTLRPLERKLECVKRCELRPSLKEHEKKSKSFILSVDMETTQQQLSVLWSQGEWQIYHILENKIEMELSPRWIRSLKGFRFLTGLKTQPLLNESGFSSLFLDADHFCFCGQTLSEENESQNTFLLTVWDVKYGTLQAKRSVYEKETEATNDLLAVVSASKITNLMFDHVQMMVISGGLGDRLIVNIGQSVFVHAFHCPPSTLLRSFSQRNQTNAFCEIASMKTNDQSNENNGKHMKKPRSKLWNSLESGEEVTLAKLLDTTEISTLEDFEQVFFDYQKRLAQVDVFTDEKKKRRVLLSFNFAKSVADRCLHEKNFWAHRVLKSLIRTKILSVNSLPDLVTVLIEKNDFELIEQTLMHVHDLTENCLCQLLRYCLLEVDQKRLQKYVSEKEHKKGIKCCFKDESATALFLNLIISAPRNDIFMPKYLKSLSVNEVITLLTFLYQWLRRYAVSDEKELRHIIGIRFPSFSQALDWVILLMDSHFTALIFSGDANDILSDIQEFIRHQIDLSSDLAELQSFLSFFNRKAPLPLKESSDYSIELLQI